MDVKPVNKWVQHIKYFATKHGMSYREAMRSEACKTAYKAPETLALAPLALPEVQEPVMEMPVLERSEPIQPKAVKKIRVKRAPKLVPT
jgi:hypothetical protein